jgi:acetylornithine deacetylase/succinyl-diaminopimelate desuccinylase-like protein
MNFKKIIFLIIFLFTNISIAQQDIVIERKYTVEIERLVKNKKIKAAFAKIKELEPKTMKRHISLTEIPSPPFKESKRAAAFANHFKELGIDSLWIDSEGNVLGLFKGSKGNRTIALDAHLDTVFPEGTDVKVNIKNDTLFAPGIGDDTRGLSMILTLIETMKATEITPKENILFIGSVGEEGLGDLRGVKHLFRDGGPKIDSWIAIDGGSIGRIYNKALGSYRYRVTFKGPGGHSWGSFGLANPHHALGEAISNFVINANKFTLEGPKTSYNVGVISGGTSINSVPFESSMQIDIRSVEPYRLDKMEILLKSAIQKALDNQNKIKRQGPNLTLELEKIGNRPSGELSSSVPLIQRTISAATYFGEKPILIRGSTNSNIPISKGIPSVTIGCGGKGGKVHSLDEWWINEEGYKAIQMALLIVLSETGI